MSHQNEEDEPKITEENYKEVIDNGIELNHEDYKKLIRNDSMIHFLKYRACYFDRSILS